MLRRRAKYPRILVWMVTLTATLGMLYGLCFRAEKETKHLTVSEKLVGRSESTSKDVDLQMIREMFKKTDHTRDGLLSEKELIRAISIQVVTHLQAALRGNFKKFFSLDKIKKNGRVEWEEWMNEFEQKFPEASARSNKERLAAAKATWNEASRSNPNGLNIDEFLAFTHPESSRSQMAQGVEEAFTRYDKDGDGKITEEEYLDDPFANSNPETKEQRRADFRHGMDSNKDGVIDKREMLDFLDPKHPYKAALEAQNLIKLLDANKDGFLDVDEVMNNASDISDSKWISPDRAFHGSL